MRGHPLRIRDFEWDEHNILHLGLGHGIEPEEAEEVIAISRVIRKTKQGHYAAFGPTLGGRLLLVVFEKRREVARVITGWDMNVSERKYYKRRS